MRNIFLFLIVLPIHNFVYGQQASNSPDVYKQHPYTTIVIPYQDEASALTFSRENSPFLRTSQTYLK